MPDIELKEIESVPLVSNDGKEIKTTWEKHKHLLIGNLMGIGNVFTYILGMASLQVIQVRWHLYLVIST